jgi:hypothetical protein
MVKNFLKIVFGFSIVILIVFWISENTSASKFSLSSSSKLCWSLLSGCLAASYIYYDLIKNHKLIGKPPLFGSELDFVVQKNKTEIKKLLASFAPYEIKRISGKEYFHRKREYFSKSDGNYDLKIPGVNIQLHNLGENSTLVHLKLSGLVFLDVVGGLYIVKEEILRICE